MTLFRQMMDDPFALAVPLLLFAGTVLAVWILRKILFAVVRKWAAGTNSHLGILFTETLRGPIILWSIILGLHIATQNSELPPHYLHEIPRVLEALWVLALTIAVSRFAGNSIRFYGGRVSGTQSVTSLTQKLVQVVVVVIGMAWLLRVVFDISLTPYLTAVGVGGLAVALALQETLSNLFAGFYVSVSGLVRLGDYIRLNTGEEGYITDINWRCTTMRGLTNNTVVIPNSKLGQAIYTNFHLPEPRMTVNVSIGVGYDSDIDRVEAMLLEETMAAVPEIKGMLADPPPHIKFIPGLGDWALVFQVNFQVNEFGSQYFAQSELRKRLFKRLIRERVTVPYPTQTIRLEPPPG